jgi:hypothetical protein
MKRASAARAPNRACFTGTTTVVEPSALSCAASCPSGVVLVAEAPNFPDTYDVDKGRITVDEETDPTGRFMRELLGPVGFPLKACS